MKEIIKSIINTIEGIYRTKEAARAKAEEIYAMVDYSAEYKDKQRNKLLKETESTLQNMSETLETDLEKFKQADAQYLEDFKFDDPELQAALTVINTSGKNLPVAAQELIVKKFVGNHIAAGILEGAFIANQYAGEFIFDLRQASQAGPGSFDAASIAARISDWAYFETQRCWDKGNSVDPLKNELERYAAAHGIDPAANDGNEG